jgi:hypothetical protein
VLQQGHDPQPRLLTDRPQHVQEMLGRDAHEMSI